MTTVYVDVALATTTFTIANWVEMKTKNDQNKHPMIFICFKLIN